MTVLYSRFIPFAVAKHGHGTKERYLESKKNQGA